MITAVLLEHGFEGLPIKVEINEVGLADFYLHLHGGPIEAVAVEGATMYLVEETNRDDVYVNPLATRIAAGSGVRMNGGYILGNALLTGAATVDGYDTDVAIEILQAFNLA